jgi:hypothetical protein
MTDVREFPLGHYYPRVIWKGVRSVVNIGESDSEV